MISAPFLRTACTLARIGLFAGLALTLAGCGFLSRDQLDNFSLTYRIDIQQGMVVTQEMADQLKPGMTREQVKFVLGTPLLTDPFHANRWDYPFRFQPGRGRIEERRFTVYFDNDRFTHFDGDKLPTEEEFAASRHFATTKIAKAPSSGSAKPLTPGASAPDVGGATVNPEPVKVPVRPSTSPTETGTPPPPPASSDGTAPR